MGQHAANVSCALTDPSNYVTARFIVMTTTLILINFAVVLGNSLVIVAVFTSEKLRSVTNMFIASLACADLMLGVLVLPFSTTVEVLGYWVFQNLWCSVWLAVDVCLSTASILNLVAISLDRYIAITRPIRYPRMMTSKRGKILIASVWITSFVICFPPLIGWNNPPSDTKPEMSPYSNSSTLVTSYYINNDTIFHIESTNTSKCLDEVYTCGLTSERGYVIYSAMGSFFVPMIIMIFFYIRIYRAALRTTRAIKSGVISTKRGNVSNGSETLTLRVHRGGFKATLPHSKTANELNNIIPPGDNSKARLVQLKYRHGSTEIIRAKEGSLENIPQLNSSMKDLVNTTETGSINSNTLGVPGEQPPRKSRSLTEFILRQEKRASKDMKDGNRRESSVSWSLRRFRRSSGSETSRGNPRRSLSKRYSIETKAAKTLAVVVGVFIICWLPFFTVYFIGAFCDDCIPPILFSIFFWLGYCNSGLNPLIYALFSKDFRFAFKRLLRCKKANKPRFRKYGIQAFVYQAHSGGRALAKDASENTESNDADS
ncbi:octopamine receptor 1-like [Lineus longissimus]|uniref:octopamine receptor 1-like n=1 Tax=Lineus longissimus TaxID=88925 RepID=UPI00315D8ECC